MYNRNKASLSLKIRFLCDLGVHMSQIKILLKFVNIKEIFTQLCDLGGYVSGKYLK